MAKQKDWCVLMTDRETGNLSYAGPFTEREADLFCAGIPQMQLLGDKDFMRIASVRKTEDIRGLQTAIEFKFR